MFNFFKKANETIKKGNAYRLEKYGPLETFAQSQEKAKAIRQKYKNDCLPKCRPFFESHHDMMHIEVFKAKFNYWDEWTGGRFARRENPYIEMPQSEWSRNFSGNKPEIELNSVCRSNPVTGY